MEKNEFLQSYQKYQLGVLPTEQPHPLTKGLAELSQSDLPKAIEQLKQVDLSALADFKQYIPQLQNLRTQVQKVLTDGGRVFLCGCGATGRLSLLSEFLWREKHGDDRVVAFMAGGDVALVHSLEGFEDYPEFGERHLLQMGFSEKDMLIATTEGGETPYVIGATQAASKISKYQSFFLHCNPEEILKEKIQRSAETIANSKITTISLFVGPMGLSGSTRMQASTVLQLAVGLALVEPESDILQAIEALIDNINSFDFSALEKLIKSEARIYEQGNCLLYCPEEFGITVFTDTTERSPTFSLPSFENEEYSGSDPSNCYIQFPRSAKGSNAWIELLGRAPHALDWPEIDEQTTSHYLKSFDFSKANKPLRQKRLGESQQVEFRIGYSNGAVSMELADQTFSWQMNLQSSLLRHTMLKMLLNIHSTLVMGVMGRYQSNVMTWVRPTNAKLIDRSARYIDQLLREKGVVIEYLQIVDKIYSLQHKVGKNESVVLSVVDAFLKEELLKQQEL